MRITSLVENTSTNGMPVEHGLSLHITLQNGVKVLFDMGQGELFVRNAKQLGVEIADVDMAVLSHGHYDHGGGLGHFFDNNSKAKVYVNENAFQPHYSLRENGLAYIGLKQHLAESDRLVKCNGVEQLPMGMTLVNGVVGHSCVPRGNRLLFGPEPDVNDDFCHEQSLLIEEGDDLVLVAGCAHAGVINIIERAQDVAGRAPTHVIAGMHLAKSGLSEADENAFIRHLALRLLEYDGCKYYTMHCTGLEQYDKLKALMGDRIAYMSCGDKIEIKKNR